LSPVSHQPDAQARASRTPKSFTALSGTRAEVQSLHNQFARQFPGRDVTLLDKAAATEEALWREAPRHRWLHIATHGFFAPPSVKAAIAVQSQMDPNARQRDEVSVFHVGHLNGLALAGANTGPTNLGSLPPATETNPKPKSDSAFVADGIVTAAELATMDLRNVEVVVLSGCETGLGELQGGEGSFGMQRSLQIAGVGTTVGSLWTVPDGKTSLLMQRFYANLWEKKQPRLQALREAQLWMLRGGKERDGAPSDSQAPRVSPHYWAAFTLSGDWR
jgi:CHAT domain-containing protein